LCAQEKTIDKLQALLLKTATTREKIDLLNDYADTLYLHKSDNGQVLALTALQLSRQENYFIGIGDACHSYHQPYYVSNSEHVCSK
jgi:hypothetical protein